MPLHRHLLGLAATVAYATSPPSLAELRSRWVDPNAVISTEAKLDGAQRDLATIQNFWGAVGIAPETTRPVDMFAVNSLELPPFAGCGSGAQTPFGCGRMVVDGQQVSAAATRWQANEAGRRSAPLPGSGVVVETATRMPFEQNGVFWIVNLTNPSSTAVTVSVDFTLSSMVNELPTVGTWVYPATNSIDKFNFSALTGVQKGSMSCGGGMKDASRDACSTFFFVDKQPDIISFPPPPPPLPSCLIAGKWIQESSGDVFGPFIEGRPSAGKPTSFSWARALNDPKAKTEGWDKINGTLTQPGNKISFHYYHTKARGGAPTLVAGEFDGDCSHIQVGDSLWHRPGATPGGGGGSGGNPAPNATFSAFSIPAGKTVTLRVALSVGTNIAAAEAAGKAFAEDRSTFDSSWMQAHDKWQQRWEQAFIPSGAENSDDDAADFWSGNLPTLNLDGDDVANSTAAGVSRVFYMSILTVVAQMRTNLPLIFKRVWPNGNGNVGHTTMGVGGSRSWWWDESLTSMMLALLEPESRAPTFQAWFAHDDHPGTKFGHGKGNGYAMDCEPIGSTSCGFNKTEPSPTPPPAATGPEYGFYCYNPWAFYMAMSNHLRVNNASSFLQMKVATSSMTVEEALEGIATDFEEYLIPGTHLVDYGPAMDGFSPTYKHVMPGCSQGNTVWVLRDFASFREAQGNTTGAARLRAMAAALSKDTMGKMYQSYDGKGRFNIIFPPGGDGSLPASAASAPKLTVKEMRHVVDFFSVTFGLCGITQPGSSLCDFTPTQRAELGNWFRQESVTSTWIRATSPSCNCSNSWQIPMDADISSTAAIAASSQQETGAGDSYPAYSTCEAGRPDHGSNGAYPSWPAFALEALCYVDRNCSSAFELMGTYAQATFEGPFGQAHEVPQLSVPPYTPLNDQPSFKPVAGVTRYIAIEGGSFFDAVVRGFFGYHAPLQWLKTSSAQEALTAALHEPSLSKGFVGSLSNLRTPFGLATITSGDSGTSIKLQPAPGSESTSAEVEMVV